MAYTITLQTTRLVLWPRNPSLHYQHVAIINWHGLEGGKVAHLFLTAKGATQNTYLFLLPLGLGAGVLSIHMTYVLMPLWAHVFLETKLIHWKLHYHMLLVASLILKDYTVLYDVIRLAVVKSTGMKMQML